MLPSFLEYQKQQSLVGEHTAMSTSQMSRVLPIYTPLVTTKPTVGETIKQAANMFNQVLVQPLVAERNKLFPPRKQMSVEAKPGSISAAGQRLGLGPNVEDFLMQGTLGVVGSLENISSKIIPRIISATTRTAAIDVLKTKGLGITENVAKSFADDVVKAVSPKAAEDILSKAIIASKSPQVEMGISKAISEVKLPQTAGLGAKTPPVEPSKPSTGAQFSPEGYVQEQVVKREAARTGEASGILGSVEKFYRETKNKLVDFTAPIEDTLRVAEKKGGFIRLPSADITNQIDRVLRTPTLAGQFVRDNGLDKVIREVDSLENLDQYLIAKQARTVAARGIETGRDLVKDNALIQAFAPKYEPYAQIVTQYSQKLLDYSVESGLINEELAAQLKQLYPDYVPLNRVFSELEKSGGIGTKAVASRSSQTIVQKLAGSEREIESPLASLMSKTVGAFKQGEQNKAARILTGYKVLPGNPFQLKELKAGESALFTVSFLDNGVKHTFETTKEIADAAKALNVQQLNVLGKIFATPVRIAKVGITGINLPFIASNIAKDQVTGIINSKQALRTSVANPAVFLKSLFTAVGHGQLYDEMARQGALGTSFDIARNQITPTIERIRAGRSVLSKIVYTVKHPSELLRAIENIVSRGEELTRIQQYAGTKAGMIKRGMSEANAQIVAARAARENTVNFARRGEWGTVLNSTFLYLNAGIQGTRTFVRNLVERPIATSVKIATVVFLPIATATVWNLSDPKRKEAYQDIAEYEKQNNIIIVPPNPVKNEDGTWNVIKVPLSQEINNLAGMARRPIEQVYGLDPVAFKDIAAALIGTVSPIAPTQGSLASTLTPQAIKPSIEALTNKSLFTGYAQVPQSLERLSPALQAKSYTSGTARQIGAKLNLSPIKVEEFIKGTFGGVGSQIINLSDRILAGLDIIPKDQIGGQNVAKAIVARFSLARGGRLDNASNEKLQSIIQKQSDDNFRLKQEAEILYTSLKTLPKDQANVKAEKIKTINPLLYAKLKDVAQTEKLGLDYNDRLIMQLGVENGERARFIWENTKAFLTRDEKNAYITELRRKKIITDSVIEQLRQLKNEK